MTPVRWLILSPLTIVALSPWAVIALIVLQNPLPLLPLVVLGQPVAVLPLGVWLAAAAAAGALVALLMICLSALARLGGRSRRDPELRPVDRHRPPSPRRRSLDALGQENSDEDGFDEEGSVEEGAGRSPRSRLFNRAERTAPPPRREEDPELEEVLDSWDVPDRPRKGWDDDPAWEDESDWEQPTPPARPPQRRRRPPTPPPPSARPPLPDLKNFEAPRRPEKSEQVGTVYSIAYERSPEPTPDPAPSPSPRPVVDLPTPPSEPSPPIANRRRPYTDAEYRVLIPPSPSANDHPPQPRETDEDTDDWL